MVISKTKNKILSIFLTLLIMVQLMPLSLLANEITSVENFTQLKDAVAASKSEIKLTADITCTAVIAVPEEANITISGDFKLINPSFNGNGKLTLDVSIVSLEVSGNANVTVKKAISAEALGFGLKVSGTATVIVNAEINAASGGIGADISSSADVTVNGDIKGGSAAKGGAGVSLNGGKLTVKGNIFGGAGDTDGGIGALLEKGAFSITGNITGGASTPGNGGVGLYYRGTKSNEISVTVTGNITGGAGTNAGAGISAASHRFALNVSGSVVGGSGTNGGNGIELFYGSQVLTATSVKGGTGTTKGGADFVDKTSSDVFGEFADDTTINLLNYNSSDLKLLSGKKSNNSLRNLVFNVYEFNVKGKFSAGSVFKLKKGADDAGINWGIAADEAVNELYAFTFTSADVTAVFKNAQLKDKDIKILKSKDSNVTVVFEGKLTNDGVSINTVDSDAVYALITKKSTVTYKITTTAGDNGNITPAGETNVNAGDKFSFTITPNEGYVVDKLIVNNKEQDTTGSNTYSIPNIDKDITISVTFKKSNTTKVNLSVSAGPNGRITPNGTISVDIGSSRTFSITPNAGYIVDKFTVNDTEVEIRNNTFTLSNITAETTVKVTFKKTDETFNVIISSEAGGTVTPTGTQTVPYGDNLTLRIKPDNGFIVNKLLIDGQLVQANNNEYTIKNITKNLEVSVTFIQADSPDAMIQPADVDWSASPIRISLSDFTRVSAEVISTIVDSFSSKQVVFYSTKYEISFAPRTLSKISTNFIDFGLIIDNSQNYIKLLDKAGDKYVSVFSFANSVTYLPAEANVKFYLGNQYIGREVTLYKYDTSANDYVQISVVSVDANGFITISTSTPSEFGIVTDLVASEYKIVASAGEGGSITPSGEQKYAQGANAIFTFAPNNGYKIDSLHIDGVKVELSGNSYTFESVNGNHTIVVTFKESDDTTSKAPKSQNTAMLIIIIFLVIVLLCAVGFVVLYKLGIIKLKNLKF